MELLKKIFSKLGGVFRAVWGRIPFAKLKEKGSWKWILGLVGVMALVLMVVAFLLGREPDSFDVKAVATAHAGGGNPPVGVATTSTLIHITRVMLEKPGGYMANDIMPPMVLMDDIPNWEWGVLTQVRDMTRSLRNDISRSRAQSVEVPELSQAEPLLNIDSDSWIFPACEGRYQEGILALEKYAKGLAASDQQNTQFYARADNLADWLLLVEKRLGSLSQRLSASVGPHRINTDLAGEPAAQQSTTRPLQLDSRTPWLAIDDVFYEARGTTWALLHLMKAVEMDFNGVLRDKNAQVLVSQIIQELEGSQRTVYSPMIMNGGGFGVFANHSLVMTSYISRAHNLVIELRDLLEQG